MLEEREDGFSCEAVVSSMQKWFESSAYKQMRHNKPKSADDQAFAVTGGVRITPTAVDLVTSVKNQADHRVAVETAAAVWAAEKVARAA